MAAQPVAEPRFTNGKGAHKDHLIDRVRTGWLRLLDFPRLPALQLVMVNHHAAQLEWSSRVRERQSSRRHAWRRTWTQHAVPIDKQGTAGQWSL